MKMKTKKRSHRYDINRLTVDMNTYIPNMCLNMVMLICIKQYLSNI